MRNPEAVRRWIREGRLKASRVGTQHIIDEQDLDALLGEEELPVPPGWQTTASGSPMPDVVTMLRRARGGR